MRIKPWQMDLIIIGGILAVGFGAGYGVRDFAATQAALKASKTEVNRLDGTLKAERRSSVVTQEVAQDVAKQTERVQIVTRDIIKEVPVYVTVEANSRCDVTDGFVRLHDAAATATPPVPYSAGQSPDASAGIEASTVVATVADNYGTCNVWREQVVGWQRWYAEQSALWPADRR